MGRLSRRSIHGIKMIVGKCSNYAAGYEASGGRQDATASVAPKADQDAGSAYALTSHDSPLPRAVLRVNRPDASFVTHLIAAAEQVPQARSLRRASVADAMSYYHAASKVASSETRTPNSRLSRVV